MQETLASTNLLHDPSIMVARPLKDLLPKELNYYAFITKCDQFVILRKNLSLHNSGKVAHMPGGGNFSAVIDAFLSKLQVNLNIEKLTTLERLPFYNLHRA